MSSKRVCHVLNGRVPAREGRVPGTQVVWPAAIVLRIRSYPSNLRRIPEPRQGYDWWEGRFAAAPPRNARTRPPGWRQDGEGHQRRRAGRVQEHPAAVVLGAAHQFGAARGRSAAPGACRAIRGQRLGGLSRGRYPGRGGQPSAKRTGPGSPAAHSRTAGNQFRRQGPPRSTTSQREGHSPSAGARGRGPGPRRSAGSTRGEVRNAPASRPSPLRRPPTRSIGRRAPKL